ncbi:hypothetical protein BLNAU_24082 [Blattamonas nauphoetae]|uniref:Uncharacterized protein n=1 Tax=Blattamonas nauphoetae TaxID=2049346 RepID=A0ABQ9WNG2_9EUKA|nr:hypothetical protein BLNAU_24082 [Blattamonas nauphoetae]
MVPQFINRTPATLFPSVVTDQLGRAQRRRRAFPLLVCAVLRETDGSILTVDHIILASEYSPDQHFVFATCLSFATSAFPKTPIDVASCTIAMEDGIVRMSALDGDAHWLLWTSCQVSELTLDSSDAKYEVRTASGQI